MVSGPKGQQVTLKLTVTQSGGVHPSRGSGPGGPCALAELLRGHAQQLPGASLVQRWGFQPAGPGSSLGPGLGALESLFSTLQLPGHSPSSLSHATLPLGEVFHFLPEGQWPWKGAGGEERQGCRQRSQSASGGAWASGTDGGCPFTPEYGV